MAGPPDPKPQKRKRRAVRVIDRKATARARLLARECACCGKPSSNADHVLPKGSPWFGDDVDENLVTLCGSGTSRCHGAKHGNPYVDEDGKRWEPVEVRRRIGVFIQLRRPDVVAYVLEKLGESAGRDHLLRRYDLEV